MRFVYRHSCVYRGYETTQQRDSPEPSPGEGCPLCGGVFALAEVRDDSVKFSRVCDPESWGSE